MNQDLSSTIDGRSLAAPRPYFSFGAFDEAGLAGLRERFTNASPFPHLVLDDFLDLPPDVVSRQFPDQTWGRWSKFEDAYQHQKRTCNDIAALPALFQGMVHELSGPSFLGFLEKVTGISGLIPDPYLSGGGLHSSGPGGILTPHADFHAYGKLNLYRRINVLVYFNPEWRAEYGGSLELFRKGENTPTVAIVPEFGRMVMFLTDDRSIHGFTRPVVGADRWRNSLALYYYTSEETERFSGDGVTYWQEHGEHHGIRRAQLVAYKVLQRGSWVLSKCAHRLNPNLKPGAARLSKSDR